jgi:hypothetical protein
MFLSVKAPHRPYYYLARWSKGYSNCRARIIREKPGKTNHEKQKIFKNKPIHCIKPVFVYQMPAIVPIPAECELRMATKPVPLFTTQL